jgi:hypothetical protein
MVKQVKFIRKCYYLKSITFKRVDKTHSSNVVAQQKHWHRHNNTCSYPRNISLAYFREFSSTFLMSLLLELTIYSNKPRNVFDKVLRVEPTLSLLRNGLGTIILSPMLELSQCMSKFVCLDIKERLLALVRDLFTFSSKVKKMFILV